MTDEIEADLAFEIELAEGVASLDVVMTLAEAVRWAAWRGQEPPKRPGPRGDTPLAGLPVYQHGASEVRQALTGGRLEAWGQKGREAPERIPSILWSGQLRGTPPVSWTEFYEPYDRIVVDRANVLAIWPAGVARHTEAQRRQWMLDQPLMPADRAHRLYKSHPQFDGTKQAEFRLEWKRLRGTYQGRPAHSPVKS